MLNRLYVASSKVVLVALAALVLLGAALASFPGFDDQVVVGVANIDRLVENLPPLKVPSVPLPTVLTDDQGHVFATLSSQDRIEVPLSKISPWVITGLVSAEDRSFFTNDGIDARGIARALVNNLLGQPVEGGSTLTQQYVKNLTELATGKAPSASLLRKLHEVVYARQLTASMTKRQILDGYLNTVYFGAGAWGIQAASQRYFSKPASDLSLPEAALLVALVRSPDYYNPLANPISATKARNRVLSMMVTNQALSQADASQATAAPLGLNPSPLPSYGCAVSSLPLFCQWVTNSLLSLPELGATRADRQAALDAGGLTITTTLDPTDQQAAEAAATSRVAVTDRVGTAVVSITPGLSLIHI